MLIICVIIGFIIGGNAVLFPISNENKAFLAIIKAYDLVNPIFKIEKLNDENKDLINDASKQILNAAFYLKENDSFTSEATQWNLKNKQVEEKFINNLQTKVSPLIKENKYPPKYIENIALLFVDADIDKIKQFNDSLENQTKDIDFKPIITLSDKIKNSKYIEITRAIVLTTLITFIFLLIGTFVETMTLSDLIIQHYFESVTLWVAIFIGLKAPPYLKQLFEKINQNPT